MKTQQTSPERRRTKRARSGELCNFFALLISSEGLVQGQIQDVSEEGLSFITTGADIGLEEQSVVSLQITSARLTRALRINGARLIWARPIDESRLALGLEFSKPVQLPDLLLAARAADLQP